MFKGRSSLKQHMPQKTIKQEIKCWVQANAATGYVYTGKKGDTVEKGLGANVVRACVSLYTTQSDTSILTTWSQM